MWTPANGTGYWTDSDLIGQGGTWIDTPTMQGVLFIAKVGQGDVWYQDSDRHAQSGAFEWMVYNPADLAAVATGAKQQWQIQPEYEWTTPALPLTDGDVNGFAGSGQHGLRRRVQPDDQSVVCTRQRCVAGSDGGRMVP